jgi:Flp pilus assembly CpaF family ATPase
MIDDQLLGALTTFLGDYVLALISDPSVSEIYVNADLVLRTDGTRGRVAHPQTLDRERLTGFLTGIANTVGQPLDAGNPIRDFELPQPLGKGRLHIKMPPVVEAPTFNLRKQPMRLLKLPELIELGSISQTASDYLAHQIADRRSILVVGPTNSGKTNFLNALLHLAVDVCPSNTRFVVIEDVPELLCPAPDTLFARTSEKVTLWHLVRATMRSSPDRIVIGEIRGPEAYPFLDIASSGHPGVFATLHAETPLGALRRLNRLARLADSELPDQFELIAEVIHVVVALSGGSRGRRVTSIAEVTGWSREQGIKLQPASAIV